jgi:hypothetical protein
MEQLQKPDNAQETIPPELRDRLEELRPLLLDQGVVQFHHGPGRKNYRLRYRELDPYCGFRVHRSLCIGPDPRVAQAVGKLVAGWQEEAAQAGKAAALEAERQRAAERAEKQAAQQKARLMKQVAMMCIGRGRRAKYAGVEIPTNSQAAARLLMNSLFTGRISMEKSKGGRPRKPRLS